MRSFIVAMGILLVVLCAIFVSYFALQFLGKKNVENKKEVYSLVLTEDWNGAGMKFKGQRESFEKHRKIYAILIDHSEMDNIELALITAEESIETANKHDSLDALSRGIFLFEHIEERNRFSFENVF